MKRYLPLCLLASLVACGGGGDGGSAPAPAQTPGPAPAPAPGPAPVPTPTPQPTGDAVRFTPEKINFSYEAGQSMPISFSAQVKRPADFYGAGTVYTVITDTKGLIKPNASITARSQTYYDVTLSTLDNTAPGRHTGYFTVAFCRDSACNSQFPGSPVSLPYDITVTVPKLSATGSSGASELHVTMTGGIASTSSQRMRVTGYGLAWTITGKPDWLTLARTSGNGSDDVMLSYNSANLLPGYYPGALTLTASDGQVAQVPVSLTITARALNVSEHGVALTATPLGSRLTRTITVDEDRSTGPAWTARSDQPWLKVTPSGEPGNRLTLTADSAALPDKQISYATITVRSPDTAFTNVDTIKVALWKGSGTPVAVKVPSTYKQLVVDTIRPYAYAHNHGAEIDVYNVYTGAKVGAIAIPGASLRGMAVSDDGEQLFALDVAGKAIHIVNPSTLRTTGSLPVSTTAYQPPPGAIPGPSADPEGDLEHLGVTRINGAQIVVMGNHNAYTPSGQSFKYLTLNGRFVKAGRDVYEIDNAASVSPFTRYTLTYNNTNGGGLSVSNGDRAGPYSQLAPGGKWRDIAINPITRLIYAANDAASSCVVYDSFRFSSLMPFTGVAPNNVAAGIDGRAYCGFADPGGAVDVWMVDANNKTPRSWRLAGPGRRLLNGQMAVSADGMMLIGLTDDPGVSIVPVGAK